VGKRKRARKKPAPATAVRPQRASPFPFLVLGVIVVVALAIRIDPVVSAPEAARYGLGPFGDSYLYHAIAYNLHEGNGYSATDDGASLGLHAATPGLIYEPAIVRAPLYPLFLAGVYTLLGSREAAPSPSAWRAIFDRVRLTQCVLDAAVCVLVFLMTRQLVPASSWPALIAATLCANPSPASYTRAGYESGNVHGGGIDVSHDSRFTPGSWWRLPAGAGWGPVTSRPREVHATRGVAFLMSWRTGAAGSLHARAWAS
jgi:hypothetical protein